ncbi:hypothetical protein SCACP_38360 [Sporomusa carbonis]
MLILTVIVSVARSVRSVGMNSPTSALNVIVNVIQIVTSVPNVNTGLMMNAYVLSATINLSMIGAVNLLSVLRDAFSCPKTWG